MSFRCSPCRLAGIPLAALFVPGWPRRPAPASVWWPPATRSTHPTCGATRRIRKRLIGANADLLQRLGKELGVRIDVLYSGSWRRPRKR